VLQQDRYCRRRAGGGSAPRRLRKSSVSTPPKRCLASAKSGISDRELYWRGCRQKIPAPGGDRNKPLRAMGAAGMIPILEWYDPGAGDRRRVITKGLESSTMAMAPRAVLVDGLARCGRKIEQFVGNWRSGEIGCHYAADQGKSARPRSATRHHGEGTRHARGLALQGSAVRGVCGLFRSIAARFRGKFAREYRQIAG